MSERPLDSLGSVRPTRQELLAAADGTVCDVIAHGLSVVFCGINPGLYTTAVGHHFARPGNRFWRALFESGFTSRQLRPVEEHELLGFGCGITNLVARTTATAAELSRAEFTDGAIALERKIATYRPRVLAVLGMGAYRTGFGEKAGRGEQARTIGSTRVWVLPNPSGAQAHYQLPELVDAFACLRAGIDGD